MKSTEKELLGRLAVLEADVSEKSKQLEANSLHSKNRDLTTDQKLSRFVSLSPRRGRLCFHLGVWSTMSVRLSVRPSVRPSVRLSVCPTLIGGVLCAALLPLPMGRLTRDLGQMTANTSQMCLLGVT